MLRVSADMHRTFISGAIATILLLGSSVSTQAQSAACPFASDAVVSTALNGPAHGTLQANIVPGLDFCDFTDAAGTDFTLSHESNVFGPGEGGAAGLALRYVPTLSDAMRDQISAFNQAGFNMALPGYDVSNISGVGDAAIWVKADIVPGLVNDSVIVQRGSDSYGFQVDDSPDAQMKLNALARAVMATLP